ncbi:hypothetical protein SteCoe_18272 [Stentor coeruleus]|uniref:C2 domain-containing protein n=1 Tax=Stentor coeruleus TaxID=5963 RepID=A0A1R2BWY0_9CILI|nr:hypothetical protein SteCoe_18272 [Stentor coeruleus]
MSGFDEEAKRNSRVEALKKIFAEMDSNKDFVLSYDEFHNHLSKKAGKAFSDELLLEIFRTIDRDKSSIISLDEFVKGFNKAEAIIQNQIKQLKAQISSMSENYTETQRSLLEAKAKKLQNIGDNNLVVVVKKAEGLRAGGVTGNKAPIVCITCEGREIKTSPVPNPTNPEWNQSFTFPITQGIGDILIEVYDTERGKTTHLLGEVAIPLRALENQELHEDFLELKGRSNADRVTGKILVALQWIHDFPSYLENLIKDYEESLRNDKEELANLENYLKELVSPINTTKLPEWVRNNERIESLERAFSMKFNSVFDETLGKKFAWPIVTRISIYLFLLLALCSTFLRPDFFNLTLAVSAYCLYVKQMDLPLTFRVITVGVILSEIYDIIWVFNFLDWLEYPFMFKLSFLLTIINLLAKLVFGAVFWKNSIDLT